MWTPRDGALENRMVTAEIGSLFLNYLCGLWFLLHSPEKRSLTPRCPSKTVVSLLQSFKLEPSQQRPLFLRPCAWGASSYVTLTFKNQGTERHRLGNNTDG